MVGLSYLIHLLWDLIWNFSVKDFLEDYNNGRWEWHGKSKFTDPPYIVYKNPLYWALGIKKGSRIKARNIW